MGYSSGYCVNDFNAMYNKYKARSLQTNTDYFNGYIGANFYPEKNITKLCMY